MIYSSIRVVLLTVLAFTLALFLTFYSVIKQGRQDVQREVVAGQAFATALVTAADHSFEKLQPLLLPELRHISFSLLPFERYVAVSGESPRWFSLLIFPEQAVKASERQLFLNHNQSLYLRANPSHEVAEIWESILVLMAVFAVAASLSIVVILWAINYQLSPLRAIIKAVQRRDAETPVSSLTDPLEIAEHFERIQLNLSREQAENNRLVREIMGLQEQERMRLAHSIHDDLGQYLAGIQSQAYLVKQLAAQSHLVEQPAERILAYCGEMQQSFRSLIKDLHPVIMGQLGFVEAVTSLAEQWQQSHGIEIKLSISQSLPTFSGESASHLYRLIQEGLNNIAAHAQAEHVTLRLSYLGEYLRMQLIDDGCGFLPDTLPGIGIRSMHERARYLAGKLTIESPPSGGTMLALEFSWSSDENINS